MINGFAILRAAINAANASASPVATNSYPALPISNSSTVEIDGGLIIDLAEDGSPRAIASYPEDVYTLSITHPYITDDQYAEVLSHYAVNKMLTFHVTMPDGEYNCIYLSAPVKRYNAGRSLNADVRLIGYRL